MTCWLGGHNGERQGIIIRWVSGECEILEVAKKKGQESSLEKNVHRGRKKRS